MKIWENMDAFGPSVIGHDQHNNNCVAATEAITNTVVRQAQMPAQMRLSDGPATYTTFNCLSMILDKMVD